MAGELDVVAVRVQDLRRKVVFMDARHERRLALAAAPGRDSRFVATPDRGPSTPRPHVAFNCASRDGMDAYESFTRETLMSDDNRGDRLTNLSPGF